MSDEKLSRLRRYSFTSCAVVFIPHMQGEIVMLRNTAFVLLSLIMLGLTPLTLAADDPTTQEAVPAEVVPAAPEPVSPARETPQQSSINTRPVNDNHTDYRYCLELKTNVEIIQCRYKKK
jgi:hypothetical protein